MKDFDKPPICNMISTRIPTLLNEKEIRNRAKTAIKDFGIKALGPTSKARSFQAGICSDSSWPVNWLASPANCDFSTYERP